MEHPLAPLFFWFNQTGVLERHHVLLNPFHLRFGHPPALNVYGDACQVGRGGLARLRCSIAVMAAELLLHQHRSHRGVHLNLCMKLLVVGFAQVDEEIARPGTAVAAAGNQSRVNPQRLAGNNRNQILIGFELFQFFVVLNTRQIQPVDFLILTEKRIVGGTKHRIPRHPPYAAATKAGPPNVARRNIPMQAKSLAADRYGQEECNYDGSLCLNFHEVVSSPLVSVVAQRQALIVSHPSSKPNKKPLPGVTKWVVEPAPLRLPRGYRWQLAPLLLQFGCRSHSGNRRFYVHEKQRW